MPLYHLRRRGYYYHGAGYGVGPRGSRLFLDVEVATQLADRLDATVERNEEPDPVDIGRLFARRLFESRGNNREVHLNEAELAAVIALAVKESR